MSSPSSRDPLAPNSPQPKQGSSTSESILLDEDYGPHKARVQQLAEDPLALSPEALELLNEPQPKSKEDSSKPLSEHLHREVTPAMADEQIPAPASPLAAAQQAIVPLSIELESGHDNKPEAASVSKSSDTQGSVPLNTALPLPQQIPFKPPAMQQQVDPSYADKQPSSRHQRTAGDADAEPAILGAEHELPLARSPAASRKHQLRLGALALVTAISATGLYLYAADSSSPPPLPAVEPVHLTPPKAPLGLPKVAFGADAGLQKPPLAVGHTAIITPLDEAHVDSMDYASLVAGARGSQTVAQPLRDWAEFRLAWAFNDDRAMQHMVKLAATAQSDRNEPILALGAATGAKILTAPLSSSKALLRTMPQEGSRHDSAQLTLVRALWQMRSPMGLEGRARTELARAIGGKPDWPDAQLILAEAEIGGGEARSGIETLSHLVLTGGPDTLARASVALWRTGAFAALRAALSQRFGQTEPLALTASWQQASPANQATLRQMAMRERLWQGDFAAAFTFAKAQADAEPNNPRARWDLARISWLLPLTQQPQPKEVLALMPEGEERQRYAFWAVDLGLRRKNDTWVASGLTQLFGPALQPTVWQALAASALARAGHAALLHNKAAYASLKMASPAQKTWLAIDKILGQKDSLDVRLAQLDAQGDAHRQDLHALVLAPQSHTARLRQAPRHARRRAGHQLQRSISSGQQKHSAPSVWGDLLGDVKSERQAFLMAAILTTAEAADRPSLAARAAEALMWIDPLLDDPIVILVRWSQAMEASLGHEASTPVATRPSFATLSTLAKALPQDDRPLLAWADLAAKSGLMRAEIDARSALLLRHPSDPVQTLGLADALIRDGHADEALTYLDALAKKTPEVRDENFLFLTALAVSQKDPARAITSLQAAIATAPQARAYNLLANLFAARSDQAQAIDALVQGHKLMPQDLVLALRLARMQFNMEAFVEAAETLETSLAKQPARHVQQAQAYELLGDIRHELGQMPQARLAYLIGAKLGDGQAALMLKAARVELRDLGMTRQAEGRLTKLSQSAPELAETYYLWGLALQDLNRPKEAKKAWRTYLRLAPQSENAAEVRELINDP